MSLKATAQCGSETQLLKELFAKTILQNPWREDLNFPVQLQSTTIIGLGRTLEAPWKQAKGRAHTTNEVLSHVLVGLKSTTVYIFIMLDQIILAA